MTKYWLGARRERPRWKLQLAIHSTGLVPCTTILGVTVVEKFMEGGWITLLVTAGVVAACHWVRAHYEHVRRSLGRLDDVLATAPPPKASPSPPSPLDRSAPTAVICVASFSGFGLHQVLSIQRSFPRHFPNLVFVSAAVLDSGTFKGKEEMGRLREDVEGDLRRHVEWARAHGLRAEYRMATGTEAVSTVEELCKSVAREFPRSVVFLGKLIFEEEKWYHRLLHNETALAIQRRLQFEGVQAMVLPIRVLDSAPPGR